MPREHRNQRACRITRSSGRNPIYETVLILQGRIRALERLVRQVERGRDALELELQRIRAEFSTYRQETEGQVLFRENRDLTLRVFNLQLQVSNMADMLSRMGLTMPVPLERAFSSFDFM